MIRDIAGLLSRVESEISRQADLAVVGMSGGADSTLVTVLCTRALGRENVHSLHMPASDKDLEKFNKNSLAVASALGVHCHRIPVGDLSVALAESLSAGLGGVPLSPLNQGNGRARMRMSCLYGVAHHLGETQGKRARVIGTGNLSEDFIGYDTKGGDALADFFPIGELFKSEVYQLLEYFRDRGLIEESMIDRTPSAGLWAGQTDEDELGYSYNTMEPSVRKMLKGEVLTDSQDAVDRFVAERHFAHKHKHEAPPVIALRSFCD